MITTLFRILLADDDEDDCMFFEEALGQLATSATLTTVADGVELMQWLASQTPLLPDVLFLDLNMPRKNGYECLTEIKTNPALAPLPVVILSTSLHAEMIERLYSQGAAHCMGKPTTYSELKTLIGEALTLIEKNGSSPATGGSVGNG
jgi:CheY-like chemotaxis protein